MTEQELHRTQIAGLAIDQDGLRAPQRVCTELHGVEADAGNPIIDEPRILPGCETTRRIPAAEQDLTWLPRRQPQIAVDGQPGLIREFKPNRAAGLFLADGRPFKSISARRYILDTDR